MALFWISRKASPSLSPCCVHQAALGPVHELAGLELLVQVPGLLLELRDLCVAGQGDVDSRKEVGLLEGLNEVAHRPGIGSPLDELLLREGGEDQHGC